MTTHAVLILNDVRATDVGALNRSVVSGSDADDIDNGNVFFLDSVGTSSSALEVWTAEIPVTGSLIGLWMAASPEVNTTVDGSYQYRGLNQDPRNFYNIGGKVFDAVKLVEGDVITLTSDALDSSTEAAFANATTAVYTFTWGAAVVADAMCLRYLATTYISIGSGAIDSQRVEAYKFEVLNN